MILDLCLSLCLDMVHLYTRTINEVCAMSWLKKILRSCTFEMNRSPLGGEQSFKIIQDIKHDTNVAYII